MKKAVYILLVPMAALVLLLCACGNKGTAEFNPSPVAGPSANPTGSPEPAPSDPAFPPTTEDLGGGYTMVTDYDSRGRKVQETTLYSGEKYPDRMQMDLDPETGKLVPVGSVTPEIVEDMVVSRTIYDYDGEGYQVQVRSYSYNAPDPDIPNFIRQEDAEGRIILYEAHNFHLDWGVTEDYYRYTFHYEEGTPDVEVTVYTSFMPGTLPGMEPVIDMVQCTVSMDPSAHGLSPGGLSYGAEGVTSFGLYEVDKEGESLRVCYYDREGNLTETYHAPQNGIAG